MVSKSHSVKEIEIVRKGYESVSMKYRKEKDPDQDKIPLFRDFMDHENNNIILELGCGTGFPIGNALLDAGKNYTDIDLSEKQIQLARNEFPPWSNHFLVAEKLEFCRNQGSESFTGVVSMFSIRHLPRIHHAELYDEIYRILKPDGLLFIDCTIEPHDGATDDWTNMGTDLMYWSGFSKKWTMRTLEDLQFKLISTFEDIKTFLTKKRRHYYYF
ncbi:MAG: Ubiquinone/menaquinone biosynthesis C-methyltransferase UbiE [Candidatus Heimdallarchaeota archaeon LC_2]|nr:MAG: Ubiquinone/menaquinone biosynthesis C-methyltransferase UbiE [Candidatus Heimdallarchaeota archaeon LC_2]